MMARALDGLESTLGRESRDPAWLVEPAAALQPLAMG